MNRHEAASLQRLETLQQLARQQEERAARQLADALAKHANAQDRHAELLRYEIEYAQGASTSAASILTLRHHAGFLTKLREAVGFQAERIHALAAELERSRSRWMALHREVEKLEQLAEAARRQIARSETRQQSRELDELAQRGWLVQQVAV